MTISIERNFEAELKTSRSSIADAVSTLAKTGQIKVWVLTKEGEEISIICASLDGAITSAINVIADQLVPYDEDNITNRLNYVDYITDDVSVRWRFDEPLRILGVYDIITSTPDGEETIWEIRGQELLP